MPTSTTGTREDHTHLTKGHTPRPRPSMGTRLPQPESDLNQGSEPNTRSSAQDHAHQTRHMQFLQTTRSRRTGENRLHDESIAQRMAQPVHPVAARTTLPGCAGILTLSTRARSLNRSTPCSREPSTTRHGTDTPNAGPRGSLNPNPISKSPSQPAGKTSGNRRPKPSLWMPWQTLGARAAWQDHSSWPGYTSPKQTSSL